MSRRCELSGKAVQVGHKVSHSKIPSSAEPPGKAFLVPGKEALRFAEGQHRRNAHDRQDRPRRLRQARWHQALRRQDHGSWR